MPRSRMPVVDLGDDDALLTLERCADLVSVNERTLRRWIAEGRLPAYKLVVGVRVRRSDLLALLQPIPAATGSKARRTKAGAA